MRPPEEVVPVDGLKDAAAHELSANRRAVCVRLAEGRGEGRVMNADPQNASERGGAVESSGDREERNGSSPSSDPEQEKYSAEPLNARRKR